MMAKEPETMSHEAGVVIVWTIMLLLSYLQELLTFEIFKKWNKQTKKWSIPSLVFRYRFEADRY